MTSPHAIKLDRPATSLPSLVPKIGSHPPDGKAHSLLLPHSILHSGQLAKFVIAKSSALEEVRIATSQSLASRAETYQAQLKPPHSLHLTYALRWTTALSLNPSYHLLPERGAHNPSHDQPRSRRLVILLPDILESNILRAIF